MGTPEVRLLTAEEIAAMRTNLEGVIQVSEHEWRVLHTLEAQAAELERRRMQQQIVHEREAELRAERDTWKAEAEDQRAAAERLRGEVEALLGGVVDRLTAIQRVWETRL